jgi:hypothetical protein
MTDLTPPAPGGEVLLYRTEDGRTRIDVRIQDETVWLSLNQMAALFQRDKSVISRHIANVFAEGELQREATVAKHATVQYEGGKPVARDIEYFNLDVIISVGYRVRSHRGTQFRIWATQRLREYIAEDHGFPKTIFFTSTPLTTASFRANCPQRARSPTSSSRITPPGEQRLSSASCSPSRVRMLQPYSVKSA